MLQRIIVAVVYAIIAYLVCIFVGGLFVALNVPIAAAVGAFLKEFAGLISFLVFLYYAAVGATWPRLP